MIEELYKQEEVERSQAYSMKLTDELYNDATEVRDINEGDVRSQAYSVQIEENRIKPEPVTYSEAMTFSDSLEWKKAMEVEYNSLLKNETWKLVALPKGRTPVKYKWVYKIKYKTDGSIERYKARLVAKGYSQKAGIDYEETYAPVIKHDSVRAMFSIAAAYKMYMVQFDIGTTFLNGDLEEEIYMCQPEGFEKEGGFVCKLQKSLYGLKQAARKWNEKFDYFLKKYNLLVSNADACVYYYKEEVQKTIVGIHVDDGLACSVDKTKLKKIIKHLEKEFEVKTSDIEYYVGFEVKVNENRDKVFIH